MELKGLRLKLMVIPLFKKVQIAKNETVEHYSVLLYSVHEK